MAPRIQHRYSSITKRILTDKSPEPVSDADVKVIRALNLLSNQVTCSRVWYLLYAESILGKPAFVYSYGPAPTRLFGVIFNLYRPSKLPNIEFDYYTIAVLVQLGCMCCSIAVYESRKASKPMLLSVPRPAELT